MKLNTKRYPKTRDVEGGVEAYDSTTGMWVALALAMAEYPHEQENQSSTLDTGCGDTYDAGSSGSAGE